MNFASIVNYDYALGLSDALTYDETEVKGRMIDKIACTKSKDGLSGLGRRSYHGGLQAQVVFAEELQATYTNREAITKTRHFPTTHGGGESLIQ